MDSLDKATILNSINNSNADRLQKLVDRKTIEENQTPSTAYVGQSDDGRSLVKPLGGAITPLRTVGNVQASVGVPVRAAAGSADAGTNIMKQPSYRKAEKNYLKIFVRADVGGFRKYWLVGVYSSPKLIAEIDLAKEKEISAKGESTGPKPKDWVFGLKTQKKGTPPQPQPFRLRTFYGDGRSYDSDFAQIYESQYYRGNGFWAGNLFLDNLSFQPFTLSYDQDESTAETVALPRTWKTTTYTNPRPEILNGLTGVYMSEDEYRQYRDLDFEVDVIFTDVNTLIDYLWWYVLGINTSTPPSTTYPPLPGQSGNAGAVEGHTAYEKSYTVLGGCFFEGVFTSSNGTIVNNFRFDGYTVINPTYYPGPEYRREREVNTRRYTNYLAPGSPVLCTLDHVRTYDSETGLPTTESANGTEYQPILRKSIKDGGYYAEIAEGAVLRVAADSNTSSPTTFKIKPSATAPEITIANRVHLDRDHSWIAIGDEVKLYECDQENVPNDWLADGSAPVKEYELSGSQYAQTQRQVTGYFKPTNAAFFGVSSLQDLKILGAYHWEKF